MTDVIVIALAGAAFACSFITLLVVLFRHPAGSSADTVKRVEGIKYDMLEEARSTRQELTQSVRESVRGMSEMLTGAQNQAAAIQSKRLSELSEQLSLRQEGLQKTVGDLGKTVNQRLVDSQLHSEARLDSIRSTVENRLAALQEDNSRKLEQMRKTVDEKLETTLNSRIGESFKLVEERLEQVYKGLGEMQNLAAGIGDLKKVLSNVKTRGVLGEVQLGAILEQILSHEQYDVNVATKRGSSNFVEYAVKMPGDGDGAVYLPIDAKFPADAYSDLCDAYDSGDKETVAQAGAVLERRIKLFAKDIRDKYLDPPNTTDFGVMFLPFEGLYAEVVRRGLLETLQRDYRVTVAGPTTMAALLNSLQMGFRTLAIQKRSGEVWQVLGAVKTEFEKFGEVLGSAQQRLEQANGELDKLVGVRTRQIRRKLESVAALPEEESEFLLSRDAAGDVEKEE